MIGNPYETLGVDKDASQAEIRKEYYRQAKRHHPDTGGDKDKFAVISRAYAIIGDPDKRAFYDRTGEEKEQTDIDKKAALTVCSVFQQVMDSYGEDIWYTDVFKEMARGIRQARTQHESTKKQAKQGIKKLEKIRKRVKRKLGTDSIIENQIDQSIYSHRIDISNKETELKVLDRALEIVKAYSWEKEKVKSKGYSTNDYRRSGPFGSSFPPPPSPFGSSTTWTPGFGP